MEQTSHHPPISHFLIYGPNNNYKLHGWSQYDIKSGLSGATINVIGYKMFTFKDGTTIKFNVTNDYVFNIFMGTMGHQLCGDLKFEDEANGVVGTLKLGAFKRKTQDYFDGEIKVNGERVSKISGNYMGYMDFDGVRFWDARTCADKVWFPISAMGESALPSDSLKRIDSVYLNTRPMDEAQQAKEDLEALQRNDRKMRETVSKRRTTTGQKFANQ